MTTHEVLSDTLEKIKLELDKVKDGVVSKESLIEIIVLSKDLDGLAQEALREMM